VARLVFPGSIEPTIDFEMLHAHPTYGYSLRPNLSALHERTPINGGQRIAWQTNAEGFRGPPLKQAPPIRVVVYGDSNILAVFSRHEDTFPAQLQTRLKSALGTPVEVVNGGVVGYGPDHYLLRFIAEQPYLKANLVIFNVFADNDFGDLLRHRHFEVRDGGLVRRDDFFVFPEISWQQRAQRLASSLLLVKAATKPLRAMGLGRSQAPAQSGASAARSDTTETYVQELRRLAVEALDAHTSRSAGYVRVDTYDVDVAIDPDSATTRAKVALMRLVLREAKRRADGFGVRLAVVIQPSRVDMTTMAPLNHRFLGRYPSYRPDALTGMVERICREEGIFAVNLFPDFLLAGADQLYFSDDDNHWNDRGQALAAHVVSQRVSKLLTDARRK
jgi:hypothetical protein